VTPAIDALRLALRARRLLRLRRGTVTVVRAQYPFLVAWKCDCGVSGAAAARLASSSGRVLALASFIRRHAACEEVN
jgi:hypothetical protein